MVRTAADLSAARRTLEDADDAHFDQAARELLVQPDLGVDPALLLIAVRRAGPRTQRFLHRIVFARLHGQGPVFDALYIALTIHEPTARRAYLEALAPAVAAGDEPALVALQQPHRWWQLPAGHELESWHVGAGKTSRVALLRRVADGALIAWKIPLDDAPDRAAMLELLARRSAEWQRLGLTEDGSALADDGRTLLQPFYAGPTLEACLRDGTLTAAMRAGLVQLLVKIAEQHRYVSGISSRNLVHDGRRWQVIDSGAIASLPGVVEAWHRQRRDIRIQWTRGAGDQGAVIESILEDAEQRLELPRFSGLRWTLARLRRAVTRSRPEKL